MKRLCALITALALTVSMVSVIFAGAAAEDLNSAEGMSNAGEQALTEEEALELLNQLAELSGSEETEGNESAETGPEEPSVVSEREEPPAGDSEGESGGESGGSQENVIEEPDGSGIPKDEPVSTTGTTYGYSGTFDLDTAAPAQVKWSEGLGDIRDKQLIFWGGTVIENSGDASLAVYDSYIRGETAVETAPLAGNPGNLLVAGNIRTTLGLGNSESAYINSTIASRNWAALSTDAAKPALEEGQKELSLYAYGSEAITMDGGYGAYSDLFCNLYSYGSHIQAAEIGIISGTYGRVTLGNIGDGEKNSVLASLLRKSDKDKRTDKKLVSIVEGGRNALMIHSVNLPPYWEYEGYSEEELPLLSTEITAHASTLRTDLSLDRGVEYEPQKQAYIDHSAGSVILIKSTNVDMKLDQCEIIPDEEGTGCLIQTVYNNDTMFMNAVPDGKQYPGIKISMQDMKVEGDIVHEDYQRDFVLTLAATELTGAMNEYDCAHWNQVSSDEGFTDYCLDATYGTHHGLQALIQKDSVWNVTEESHLSKLTISPDAQVNGIILVDGTEVPNIPGMTYEGAVVVIPGTPEPVTEEETTTEEPETEHEHSWVDDGTYGVSCTDDGIHVYTCSVCGEQKVETVPALGHNWVRDGGSPASCTQDGTYGWVCTRCGESYVEVLEGTAMGHDWQLSSHTAPTCASWGQDVYHCSRCAEVYYEDLAPLEHNFQYVYTYPVSCVSSGYDVYQCPDCGAIEHRNEVPAYGHSYHAYPTPGAESLSHTYECLNCGDTYTEPHAPQVDGACPVCGYVGAYGKNDDFHGSRIHR